MLRCKSSDFCPALASLPAQRGVALIEVLLSVAVLAAALGVTMDALGKSVRNQSQLQQRAQARRLAEGIAHQLKSDFAFTQSNESNGRFEAPFAAYVWTAVSRPPGALNNAFASLDVKVSMAGNQRVLYHLKALIAPGSAPLD